MNSVVVLHQNLYMWVLHVGWDSHGVIAGSKKECPKSGYPKRPAYAASYDLALGIPKSHFLLLSVSQASH